MCSEPQPGTPSRKTPSGCAVSPLRLSNATVCCRSGTGSVSKPPCLTRKNFSILSFPLLCTIEAGRVSFAPWHIQSRYCLRTTSMLSTLTYGHVSDLPRSSLHMRKSCPLETNVCSRTLVVQRRDDPEVHPTATRHPQHVVSGTSCSTLFSRVPSRC